MSNARRAVRNRRPRRTAAVAATLAALVGVVACSKTETTQAAGPAGPAQEAKPHTKGAADADKPVPGGNLTMGLEADAEGLDPTRFAFAASGHFLASAVYEPLATLDDAGNPVPYLASSIVGTDSYKTWTITVPTGLTFSDGDKLDAEVVRQNLQAHRDSIITGSAFASVTSIDATSSTEVVVKLSKPWAGFSTGMTSQAGYVISPKMLADGNMARTPIGSGPFVYDNREDGKRWTFKKNTKYRQPGKPYLESIEFQIITDESLRVSQLQKGDLDMLHTYKPDQVLSLRSGEYKLVDYNEGEEDFLVLNHARPPLNNRNARLAVAHAVNVDEWRKTVMKGVEQPSNSPFAPGQPGYEENNGFPTYDTAKAKDYVAKYKAETGKDIEVVYQHIDNSGVVQDAQFFKANLEAVGIKVTLSENKQIGLVAQTATGNFDISQFRNFGFHDPDTDTVFWRKTSAPDVPGVALNFPRFFSDKTEAALDKATAATSATERDEAYKALQREFAQEVPYLWLGRPTWILAARSRVNGIYAGANGSIQTLGGKTWLSDLFVTG